jgi:hypothetical protein
VTVLQERTNPPRVSSPEVSKPTLPRRFVRGTLFWLFGLSASVLLGSLWGSAVVSDRDTVTEVAREVAAEQIAQERIVGWVTEGLGSVGLIVPDDVPIVDRLLEMPATEQVLVRLTDQLVEAAFAPVGSAPSIDPASALLPAVPEITRVLADSGVAADERAVAAVVSGIEPIPLEGGGKLPVRSAATRVSTVLSLAAVLAGTAMLVLGGGAVLIGPDRMAAVRLLAYRMTLTSLSLALMLRFGSWIADPVGGGTPWRSGLSDLLASHTHVPLFVAGAAAVAGAGAVLATNRLRSPSAGRTRVR